MMDGTRCPRCGEMTVLHTGGPLTPWRECPACGLEIPLGLSPYERKGMMESIAKDEREDGDNGESVHGAEDAAAPATGGARGA